MKKFLWLYLVLLVSFTQVPLYPFISYSFLKNQAGHSVLILGDRHYEEQLKKLNTEHTKLFVQNLIANSTQNIPCLLEIGDEAPSLFTTGEIPTGINIGDTYLLLAKLNQQYKVILSNKVNFIPYEPRGRESSCIAGLFFAIEHFLTNEISFSSAQWHQVKQNCMHICSSGFTLTSYFNLLNKNLLELQALREASSSNITKQAILDAYISTFIQAKSELESYFSTLNSETSLELAFLNLFDTCTTEEGWKKYRIAHKLYQATDWKYADALFLQKTLTVVSQSSHKLIFILGISHAQNLNNALKKLGYEPVKEKSLWYEQDTFSCIKGNFEAFSIELAEATKLFLAEESAATSYEVPKSCAVCKQEGQSLRCSRCKVVYYCNQDCQRKHWPTHKFTCKPQ